MSKLTPHEAAAMERQAWMRKIRRILNSDPTGPASEALRDLLEWGKGRSERYRRRPGGLGKVRR